MGDLETHTSTVTYKMHIVKTYIVGGGKSLQQKALEKVDFHT